MIGLHWARRFAVRTESLRILRGIWERRIVENLWGGRNSWSDDECLDAKAPPKVLDGIAISVGLHIPLVPRQPKRRVGHLDYEEIESGIERQTKRYNEHVFGLAV